MGWIRSWFRKRYEAQVSLKNGYLCFLANFYYLQLTPQEYVTLSPPSKNMGDVTLTASDGRPKLTFKYWPKGMEFREAMPMETLVLEEGRISRKLPVDDSLAPQEYWDLIEFTDLRVQCLYPLFHAMAFYQPMRTEHKKRFEDASGA